MKKRNINRMLAKVGKQVLLLFFPLIVLSQSVIFSESCGNPSATTLVNIYTGWQNNGVLTFAGNADVRNTVPSTTYAGASGLGNVFITNALNTNVTISGINTANYTNLSLSFGHLKTTNASNGSQLAIEVSVDGTTWTTLTYSVPTGGSTANVWRLVTPTGSIPSTANLRIRFRMATATTGLQFRIDDIKLVGCLIPSPPTYSVNTPACQSTTLTFPSSTFLQTLATDTSRTLASPQVLSTSGTRYLRTVSTVIGCTSVWSTATSVPITIVQPPTITLNPRDTAVQVGQVVYFFASSPDSFYWESSSDSFTWTPIDLIKRDTLVMPGADMNWDTYYRITARKSPCSNVSSSVAKLTVYQWPLPIVLLSFKGMEVGSSVLLEWITTLEINNHKFVIERSTDGIFWDIAGEVIGSGYSDHPILYKYTDDTHLENYSVVYYKIKQVDYNGDYEYFPVISVDLSKKDTLKKQYFTLDGREVNKLEKNRLYIQFSNGKYTKLFITD